MTSKQQTRSRAYETPVDCALVGYRWKALFVPGQFRCTLCGRRASCTSVVPVSRQGRGSPLAVSIEQTEVKHETP
jgi:hypothetical protein